MIYHICNPSIYISQFYLFSNKYKIHGNLDFRYIFLEKTDILTNRKDVRYVSFFRLLKLFLLLKNNDRVILHSYSHPFLYVCCFLCFFKLNRFAWVIWGGDLYFYREYKNSLKYRLYEFLRKNTIRRFISNQRCLFSCRVSANKFKRKYYFRKTCIKYFIGKFCGSRK